MNSNYTTDRKSTQELKQQVIQDINKIKEDFEEIKQRMTPGQLIDDAIYYRHGRTPAETFDYLKANPVGTGFLTLGTLLLMEDENHRSYESMARDKAHVVTDKFGNAVHSAQDKLHSVQDKIHNVQDKVQDKWHSASSRASELKEKVVSKVGSKEQHQSYSDVGFGEGMDVSGVSGVSSTSVNFQDTKEKIGEQFSDAKESVREGVQTAKSKLNSAAASVKNRAYDAVESAKHLDPLTYLALGAGLGTITGAALPVSAAESEMIDSKFEESLVNFSQELQDALNESINILKNEFIGGFTEINMQLF